MSSFGWIDHSEKQRRQVLEAIDLFREKDTRDELGLASIRDAISDTFFPGTGALQTRARYFFFVPWIIQQAEARRQSSSDLARRVKDVELRLIDTLMEADSGVEGVIGRRARKSLARFPSSIYWNGLKVLKFTSAEGSIQDYFRAITNPPTRQNRQDRNDDGEPIVQNSSSWNKAMPSVPGNFPEAASLNMTRGEAMFLKEQVLTHHPASLFAFFLNQGVCDSACEFTWDQPATAKLSAQATRQLELARTFSEVMHGAAILYNRALAELEPRREEYIENTQEALDLWKGSIDKRQRAVEEFSGDEFWAFVRACGHKPSMQTEVFVEAWFRTAIDVTRRKAIESDARAVDLVRSRERLIKGPMARFDNRRVREMWLGEAGMGQLSYRWPNAEWLINDIVSAEQGSASA